MHLLQVLYFMELFHFKRQQVIYQELTIHWQDLLSHNKLPLFISKVPQANPEPTEIQHQLPQVLLDMHGNWTSPF